MFEDFTKKDNINKKSAYLLGGIVGVLVSVAAMLAFAAILLFLNLDRTYAAPFATISVAVGSFVASRITAKKIGDRGYLVGLIIGLTVFCVITALSLILGNNLTINTLFHFVIIVLSSLVGGIMGVNADKNKKYI